MPTTQKQLIIGMMMFLQITASPVARVTGGDVCKYAGNAGCLADCETKGYNCRYCSGTEPNEVCICEHCNELKKVNDLSCTNGGEAACIASCKVQSCRTGHCVGTAPDETCVCSGCSELAIRFNDLNLTAKSLNTSEFKAFKRTLTSMCIKGTGTQSLCQTQSGCNWCGVDYSNAGYDYFCCNTDRCCCYQYPSICGTCIGQNDCLAVYNMSH